MSTFESAKMSGCVQSSRPEDTYKAREEGLDAEDFAEEPEVSTPARRCLTAEEILSAEDRPHNHWVPTPEWGGPGGGVYLLTPSGEDRNRYEQTLKRKREKVNGRWQEVAKMSLDDLAERLTVDFVCNEAGERLFTRDHVVRLRKKAAAPVARIGSEVCRLMGWTEQDLADLVGNSETGRS